jgi:CubicO group peptidase (beta-lactamase class C family)
MSGNEDFSPTIECRFDRATVVTLGWMNRIGLNSSIMSRFLFFACAMAVVLACTVEPLAQVSQQKPQDNDWTRVPGVEWERVTPESMGYSSARLEALRGWLKTQQTAAMVIVVHGKVIFEYGDLSLATKVASVRKSVLGMLYGNYVFSGKIDLDKTVKELGLDDKEPFLSIEERATLEQLLTSRSGIYLPSGNKDLDLDMPKRGSEYPGTHFVYNNWDFNAAGTAFEKLTGKNIYDAVESDIARPIAMQDYDRSRQKKIPTISVHSEYHFDLSTRDMARLGLLMQRGGNWNGKQIIPGDWVRYTTTLVTPFNDINPTSLHISGRPERWGYGAMWWVWDAPVFPGRIYDGPLQGAYTAMGTGGQYITVLPKEDIVIAHKVNIDKDARANISPEGYDAILAMVIDSKCAGSCP